MQTLQEKASQWSGVDTADAFAIDDTNLFQKLGLQTFINLSTNFYTRVYDDEEEEWFRSIFSNSKKEEAIQNQYEFFVQRMGGPPLYSQRKARMWHTDISRKIKKGKSNIVLSDLQINLQANCNLKIFWLLHYVPLDLDTLG
ncbi:two-on-two hemoglobin-3 isoform X2 [Gossypium raimondii]|uniref:two-on-two hemoglobin-3 isoform X2 n=1 Tax=Gossypium raimondii TaxID=29730 RepID=UPI00227B218F|nr:two-on-two hemoglobin-3 isoform X2 [Gossypium raimondii]